MKNFSLLIMILFFVGSCDKRESPIYINNPKTVANVPSDVLIQKISQTGVVSFKSWNGNLRGLDNDDVLHFSKKSKVVLERMGLGVDYFEGTYTLTPDGQVAVAIKGIREAWPLMILRTDGTDLLLYREDGHTSWLSPDDPELPVPEFDGFWPFRAK